MSIYKQLKRIHPDLQGIKFDGGDIELIFPGGSENGFEDYEVGIQEFKSNSETYALMAELEELLMEKNK